MGHRKQVLHLAKVVAAMFFLPHPYIVAPTGATDYEEIDQNTTCTLTCTEQLYTITYLVPHDVSHFIYITRYVFNRSKDIVDYAPNTVMSSLIVYSVGLIIELLSLLWSSTDTDITLLVAVDQVQNDSVIATVERTIDIINSNNDICYQNIYYSIQQTNRYVPYS